MRDLALIEAYYKSCIDHFIAWIPEGIYVVDLPLLHRLGLLHFQPGVSAPPPVLSHSFYLVESLDKLTLINDEFVVWLVSRPSEKGGLTYLLIALNAPRQAPRLEAAIVLAGVYNGSHLALRILEKFLNEIHETEKALSKIG